MVNLPPIVLTAFFFPIAHKKDVSRRRTPITLPLMFSFHVLSLVVRLQVFLNTGRVKGI